MKSWKNLRIFTGLLSVIFFTVMPSFALIEDEYPFSDDPIELEIRQDDIVDKVFEPKKENKFIKKRIGEPSGSPFDLFRSSGYTFESGPIKNQKFRYFFHGGDMFLARTHEDLSNTLAIAANEIQSETTFRDNKTKFFWGYNFSRNTDYDNNFFEKVSFIFLDHYFNEHQMIRIGQMRNPNGYEGGNPSSMLKLVTRSQIARTFGNYSTNGIKNIGNYKYLTYDVGFYDGSRFFNNNFQGYEFAALASFKPLTKFGDKYGNLKIGGSIDVGNSANAFTVVGGHAIYEYKKLYADFEYMYSNGNSGIYYGKGRAHGLFTTVGYKITPKLEILGRYDFFQNLENDKVAQEYTAGLTYYFNPQVKFMFNYVYAMNDHSSKPSHRIYIGGDFLSSYLLDLL